jgi:hypothetical protein
MVTVIAAEVAELPATSVATAVSLCVALATFEVFQLSEYGLLASVPSGVVPAQPGPRARPGAAAGSALSRGPSGGAGPVPTPHTAHAYSGQWLGPRLLSPLTMPGPARADRGRTGDRFLPPLDPRKVQRNPMAPSRTDRSGNANGPRPPSAVGSLRHSGAGTVSGHPRSRCQAVTVRGEILPRSRHQCAVTGSQCASGVSAVIDLGQQDPWQPVGIACMSGRPVIVRSPAETTVSKRRRQQPDVVEGTQVPAGARCAVR